MQNASAGPAPAASNDASRRGPQLLPIPTEGESRWTSDRASRFGGPRRMTGAALRLRGIIMASADQFRGARERDKLTIAEVCADLGVSRRTFYEWRAKGQGAPVHNPAQRQPAHPEVRIPALAGRT